jgi:hypothetical protein
VDVTARQVATHIYVSVRVRATVTVSSCILITTRCPTTVASTRVVIEVIVGGCSGAARSVAYVGLVAVRYHRRLLLVGLLIGRNFDEHN